MIVEKSYIEKLHETIFKIDKYEFGFNDIPVHIDEQRHGSNSVKITFTGFFLFDESVKAV